MMWKCKVFSSRMNVYLATKHSAEMSRDMTKPTKWLCAQRRLRSAWASAQSSLCAEWVAKDPSFSSCGQRRLWSDWADAQADLSLRWVHILLVLSCRGSNVKKITLIIFLWRSFQPAFQVWNTLALLLLCCGFKRPSQHDSHVETVS